MNTEQVRGFVAIAECQNMSLAARRLYLSQPALSRQVDRLEDELGAQLVIRSGRYMRLTDFGIIFLPEAYRILDDIDHAIKRLKDAGKVDQSLRVGHHPLLMSAFIGQALMTYATQFPNIHIEIVEPPIAKQINLLRAKALDVVCTEHLIADDLSSEKLATVPLLQVSALGNLYAKNRAKGLHHYRDEVFFVPDRTHHPNGEKIVREVCRRAGFAPKTNELGGVSSVLMAIALGKGTAILPAHCCLVQHPGVHYQPLALALPAADVVAITRRDALSYHTRSFIKCLRTHAQLRYKQAFWNTGSDSHKIAFPGKDRRTTIRRR